jgi:phage-related minor tail protein
MRLTTTLASSLLGGAFAALSLTACESTYYKTMEMFGKEKRDILATRVTSARDDQAQAKQQFQSALDRLNELVNAPDTDLKKAYDKAKADFDASEAKAKDVRDRIKKVEDVAGALFEEWKKEIQEYDSDKLRQQSTEQLQQTQARYNDMLAAMKKAEASMDPVLAKFRDNVLFLKHNLNAQTVASLKGTMGEIEQDIGNLIKEMERSMAEADTFVQGLSTT